MSEVTSKTTEEKIMNFIDSREAGTIKLNDFLKSLYPLPKQNEPPVWTRPAEMKALRNTLEAMKDSHGLFVNNNAHLQLGRFYYDGDQQVQKHHNLLTVTLEVKK